MDFNKFEQLNGIELGLFVANVAKNERLDETILDYYKSHKANLDGPHLEMIISLLGKLGSAEALREVSIFLDHPIKYIQYQALEVIARLPAIDEMVMTNVVAALSKTANQVVIEQLKMLLERGSTEGAKSIAKKFRDSELSK